MKTKLVYVLVSSKEDLYWEQCLISVMSARYQMPQAQIYLVCDDQTNDSLRGIREEIKQFITKLIVIPFDNNVEKLRRSRILKVTLRKIISGDFLYIDCDTLITYSLDEIDNFSFSLAAVLDGHCIFKKHPMFDFFVKQNKHLDYPIDKIVKYFNGGVMYVKDNIETHTFYEAWHTNYLISCSKGSFIDEPSLSKTNIEHGYLIHEIDGSWNCQIRFGALYLSVNKILHFCSKKNMPVSYLSQKAYLKKIKEYGINTENLMDYIRDWKSTIPQGLVTCVGEDASFAVSPLYESSRKHFINNKIKRSLYIPHHNFKEYIISIRNNILGKIAPNYLSQLLYKESFGTDIRQASEYDFNKMLYTLSFHSNNKEWSTYADKLAVRNYIASKGLKHILPVIYKIWDNSQDIDFESLPNKFVLKCNHDNGSTIVVIDRYSINDNYVKKYYSKKLSKQFGMLTAEPHYMNIPRKVFAEEYLENDKPFSDSLVSYKFFSFYGIAEYCQIIYDSTYHKNKKSIIYRVSDWKKQVGFINKNEGNIDIPCPKKLEEMIDIVKLLSEDLPFCRVDLYEINDRIYFSELTFMPGAGRIKSFSQHFLNILGKKLKTTEYKWKLS